MRARRALAAGALAVAAAALIAACSGRTPNEPSPPPGGGNQQPPANNLPVIESITIQGTRNRQPPNFADVGEAIPVSAKARDDETAAEQLTYQWSATAGTFSGTGANVTWTAPSDASTPVTVTITLTVVERYGPSGSGVVFEHRVSRSATLSLHHSIREVGEMARQFLLDFSDSNIRDVSHIMRNFEPGCYGTAEEAAQVARNRADLRIVDSRIGDPAVTIEFGGVCSFRSRPGDACAHVPVFWASVLVADGSRQPSVRGTDQVAAMYYPAQSRWRLCDSQFDGELAPTLRAYFK